MYFSMQYRVSEGHIKIVSPINSDIVKASQATSYFLWKGTPPSGRVWASIWDSVPLYCK